MTTTQFILALAMFFLWLYALVRAFDQTRPISLEEAFLLVLWGLLLGLLLSSYGLFPVMADTAAAAGAVYAFQACESCTNKYSCAKNGECSHNPMTAHCPDCGHIMSSDQEKGYVCRNIECEDSPDYDTGDPNYSADQDPDVQAIYLRGDA